MEDNNFFLKGEASNQLRSIGRWTTFFAILQLIGVIFMLLVGVCCFICGIVLSIASGEFAEAFAAALADQYPSVSPIAIIWIYALVYLIFGGLYIPYTIYLFRASKAAREASENLTDHSALDYLTATKKFWRFYGILVICSIAFVLLCVPIVAFVAAAASL